MSSAPSGPNAQNTTYTFAHVLTPIETRIKSKSLGALLGVHGKLQEINSGNSRVVSLQEFKKIHQLEVLVGKSPTSLLGQIAEVVSAAARACLGQGFKSARQLIREELSTLRSSVQLQTNLSPRTIQEDFDATWEKLCGTVPSEGEGKKAYDKIRNIISSSSIDPRVKVNIVLFLEEALTQLSELPLGSEAIKKYNAERCIKLLQAVRSYDQFRAPKKFLGKNQTTGSFTPEKVTVEKLHAAVKQFIQYSNFLPEKKTEVLEHLEIVAAQYSEPSNEEFITRLTKIFSKKSYELPGNALTILQSNISSAAKQELLTQITIALNSNTTDESRETALQPLNVLIHNANSAPQSVTPEMIRTAFNQGEP